MELSLKQLMLRPTGIKLFQDTRSPSKRSALVLIRCNNRDYKILMPTNSESLSKIDYISLKGLDSSQINIKVYGSDVITSSNLLGELNLLLGALAQEDPSQIEWKQLTKLGRKVGEILIELQTEDKPDSNESFYSSKSKPDAINKDQELGKSAASEPNQQQSKLSSRKNSQESPSIDQKQLSEGKLSETNRSKDEVAPAPGSNNSIVSVESPNQKQNAVSIQVEDKGFKPFKGLVQLSNGGEFFKTSHTNQDVYIDIEEPQEKPAPKKPMGAAKWMLYLSQLVNPSLNY